MSNLLGSEKYGHIQWTVLLAQATIILCCRLFRNVSIQDPRNNSDHYMVLGFLHSAPLMEHARYLGGRKQLPLLPPTALTREDGIFAALSRAVLKPLARDARKNAWISEDTCRLVNKRFSARQDPAEDQALFGGWYAPLRRA